MCICPNTISVIIQLERMMLVNEDNKTIALILDGKKDHFAVLMNKYHNEIFSFVFNMLGQYQDTEDIIQEIFIKTYKYLSKYNNDKSSFRTWLYRISSNHTINYLNSSYYKKKSSNEIDNSRLQDTEDIERDIIKEEQIKQIVIMMRKVLTVKHQKIVSLHYFSGLTVKEIGESLEIPEKTIYKALKTSIEKIKKEVATNE